MLWKFQRAGWIVVAFVLSSGAAFAESVADILVWPPAYEKLFGNPEIVIKPGTGKVRISGTGSYRSRKGVERRAVRSKVIVGNSGEEQKSQLAKSFSRRFYAEMLSTSSLSYDERRLKMRELVNLSESSFIELSTRMLLGGKAGSESLDAWWKVRMGLPLTPDHQFNLLVTVLHSNPGAGKSKESAGHLSLGLREKGGDPDGDFIIDFRAPWYFDREPRVTEGVNLDNSLKLSAITANLYDWLATQTKYRECYVDMWFLPIYQEQVTLLRYFHNELAPHDAGNYRAFRKNCASLAILFFDRLRPITEPIPARTGLADLPVAESGKILSYYGEVPYFQLTDITGEIGRGKTAKSEIHRAVPTRATSRSFQLLAAEPDLN